MSAIQNKLRSALDATQQGFSLPGAFYNDDDLFKADIEAIFYKEWLFVGPECEIPNAGDYVTLTVHDAPIIVLRDNEEKSERFITLAAIGALGCVTSPAVTQAVLSVPITNGLTS